MILLSIFFLIPALTDQDTVHIFTEGKFQNYLIKKFIKIQIANGQVFALCAKVASKVLSLFLLIHSCGALLRRDSWFHWPMERCLGFPLLLEEGGSSDILCQVWPQENVLDSFGKLFLPPVYGSTSADLEILFGDTIKMAPPDHQNSLLCYWFKLIKK